jgi:hypothetical protein
MLFATERNDDELWHQRVWQRRGLREMLPPVKSEATCSIKTDPIETRKVKPNILKRKAIKIKKQSWGGSIYRRWMGPFLIGGDSPRKTSSGVHLINR